MSDRDTLLKISKIMRRLLLVSYDPVGPIPRKGTTRHECYRALYEIQNLLHTNMFFATLPPQTNADRIRAMTDEELADFLTAIMDCCGSGACGIFCPMWECCCDQPSDNVEDWLKSPVEVEG